MSVGFVSKATPKPASSTDYQRPLRALCGRSSRFYLIWPASAPCQKQTLSNAHNRGRQAGLVDKESVLLVLVRRHTAMDVLPALHL